MQYSIRFCFVDASKGSCKLESFNTKIFQQLFENKITTQIQKVILDSKKDLNIRFKDFQYIQTNKYESKIYIKVKICMG